MNNEIFLGLDGTAFEIQIQTRGGLEVAYADMAHGKKLNSVDRWGIFKDSKGRKFARSGKKSGQLFLHKLLFDVPKGCHLEWKNGNTLDCRSRNLQIVDKYGQVTLLEQPQPKKTYPTRARKPGNTPTPAVPELTEIEKKVGIGQQEDDYQDQPKKSDVRGVYFHKASRRWHAAAFWGGKRYSLGYYDDTALGKQDAEQIVTNFRDGGPELTNMIRGLNNE